MNGGRSDAIPRVLCVLGLFWYYYPWSQVLHVYVEGVTVALVCVSASRL